MIYFIPRLMSGFVLESEIATVGISSFAQSELGDIVFVEIDTEGQDPL